MLDQTVAFLAKREGIDKARPCVSFSQWGS